jgi:hypothetical protein
MLEETEAIVPATYLEAHKDEVQSLTQGLLDAVEKVACQDPKCSDPNCVVDAVTHTGFLQGVDRRVVIAGGVLAVAGLAAGVYAVSQKGKHAREMEVNAGAEVAR